MSNNTSIEEQCRILEAEVVELRQGNERLKERCRYWCDQAGGLDIKLAETIAERDEGFKVARERIWRLEAEGVELRQALAEIRTGKFGAMRIPPDTGDIFLALFNKVEQVLASTTLAAEHLRQDAERDEALLAAEHELTIVHGLTATDKWDAYNDALEDGADHSGAYDCLCKVTWTIDTSEIIGQIDKALGVRARRVLGKEQ